MKFRATALKEAYEDGLKGLPYPSAGELYLEWEKGYKLFKRGEACEA